MSTRSRALFAAIVLTARGVAAQTLPLAHVQDDPQLTAALQSITQDPAIAAEDPGTRPLALALMTEGVKQRRARAFDQALANFLEAYARFPSPKILLGIASTLRDMGRIADAANTYQRYLNDPATGAERVAEVKALLIKLDEQLTILDVRVSPRGAELSIDGGPFIPVGGSLATRVRAGLHLVRIRKDALASELTVNGFEGETKEVAPALPVALPPAPARPPVARSPYGTPPAGPPEHVDGWLVTGTQYGTADATSRERTVRDRGDGKELTAIVPHDDDRAAPPRDPGDEPIGAGALAVLRIDGKGRGFAGGLGLAISRGHFEAELMVLKSDQIGGYLGLRYRLLTGSFRPYAALGTPGFAFNHDELADGITTTTARKLAVGVRAAAGIELRINGHLSVQGDLGYEHFFFVDERFEADVFVPTLGMIGRL